MTVTTTTEPAVVEAGDITRPRCEAMMQCPDKCHDPAPCDRPAAWRVTFRCASRQCDHAGDLLLLCTGCTEQAADIGPVLGRRPL